MKKIGFILALFASICIATTSISFAAGINPNKLKGWQFKKTRGGVEATCPASKCGTEIEAIYTTSRISSIEKKWLANPNGTYTKLVERSFKNMFGAMSFMSPMKFTLERPPQLTKIKGNLGYNANFIVSVRGTNIKIYASMALFVHGKKMHGIGGIAESKSAAIKGKNKMLSAWRP